MSSLEDVKAIFWPPSAAHCGVQGLAAELLGADAVTFGPACDHDQCRLRVPPCAHTIQHLLVSLRMSLNEDVTENMLACMRRKRCSPASRRAWT